MGLSAWKSIIAAMLVCSLVAAGAVAETVQPQQVVAVAVGGPVLPVPTPAGASGSDTAGNYSKLEISPSYLHFTLKPGESDEQTVTIRNRDSRTITVRPFMQNNPYGGIYQAENSWISVTPEQEAVPAGESAKFTVRATVPDGTARGSYNAQIAVTDEQYPSPYPQVYPGYIHAMGLSIDVAMTPVIRITPAYISDQIEAGNVYRYTVNLTNAGTTPIALSPKAGSDSYLIYSSSGPVEPVLNASSFAIAAPSSIPPGGNATMTVTVQAPPNRSGSYNGYIDLGIDDPRLREGEGRISLSFMVWQQPPGAFTRQFSMSSPDTITVRLTATPQSYPAPGVARDYPVREPSFDVTLAGPSGNVAVRQTKKEIRGTVSVGADPLVYGTGTAGEYQQVTTQYTYTYTAQGRAGAWTLAVTPRNTQTFEYTISFGNDQGDSPLGFLQPSYFSGARGTNPG